ncbi:MAG: hypothetical protein EAZ30_08235 [Betaproteobacteria bacterium]|nr:MAG: hypothetical protein EAZ30_08235 [Betaproteobacteria bacterium]
MTLQWQSLSFNAYDSVIESVGDMPIAGNESCGAAVAPGSLNGPRISAAARFPVVVMGVSGCGNTTLGQALAAKLGSSFFDADDFHRQENVEKTRRNAADRFRPSAVATNFEQRAQSSNASRLIVGAGLLGTQAALP